MKYKHAKMLADGYLHFSCPSTWIEMAKEGNVGQGDPLEGACLYQPLLETIPQEFVDSWCDIYGMEPIADHPGYYRYKGVTDLPTSCFYMLKDSDATTFDDGSCRWNIAQDYFSDFSDHKPIHQVIKMSYEERPVMVVIINTPEFIQSLTDTIRKEGFQWGRDCWAGEVFYKDFTKPFANDKPHPYELFLKHDRYQRQSEGRYILSPRAAELLNDDGNLYIGSQRDNINIQGIPSSDFVVEEKDGLPYFSFQTDAAYTIRDMKLEELFNALPDILDKPLYRDDICYIDGLPSFWMLKGLLKDKYNITIEHDAEGNANLAFNGDSRETIHANETRDQYHYCGFDVCGSRPEYCQVDYNLYINRPSPAERLEAIEEYKRLNDPQLYEGEPNVAPLA